MTRERYALISAILFTISAVAFFTVGNWILGIAALAFQVGIFVPFLFITRK